MILSRAATTEQPLCESLHLSQVIPDEVGDEPTPGMSETFPKLLVTTLFLAGLKQTAENPLGDTAETAR